MGKKSTGIYRDSQAIEGPYWQVDKWYRGSRIRSRGFSSFDEAQDWLNRQIQELRDIGLHGKRPRRTFEQAAIKHLNDNPNKVSLESDVYQFKKILPYIGHLELGEIGQTHVDQFIADFLRPPPENGASEKRGKDGRLSAKTINLVISLVNTVLGRAATEWKHENNTLWLDRQFKLKALDLAGQQRPPRPILWEEQIKLLAALPSHLQDMTLFCTNSGVRDNVVCQLRWSWEVRLPEFGNSSVFLIPKEYVKGRKKDEVIICNSVAQAVIDKCRGRHTEFVFVFRRERVKNFAQPAKMRYQPIQTMNNTAWQRARTTAGLGDLHVHDLRHTFATRLREAGVADASISALLWHGDRSITDHYAGPMLRELFDAVEKVARDPGNQNRSMRMLIQQHQFRLADKASATETLKVSQTGEAK
ncbi:MAG: tyrosine-type recombinase/integrase [Burkholderiales bacterium]|nr:tyrosine-type recombinase/integrase [Burkholderiales bacterium]